MNVLELADADTGGFRIRLLRKGEPYGPHHRFLYEQDEPMLEFYGSPSGGEVPGEGYFLGRYVASDFRRPRRGETSVGDGHRVSPANARAIAAWLESELSPQSTSLPSAPERPWQARTDRSARLNEAGERRATLYTRGLVGYHQEEAEWVEVTLRADGDYAIDYLPRGRRRVVEMVFHSRPRLVILLGWDHPDLQPRMPPEEHSIPYGQHTLRYTVQMTGSVVSNRYREKHKAEIAASERGLEQGFAGELDAYLADNPLTRVLLDLRGDTKTEPRELARRADQLILHPTGVRDPGTETARSAVQAAAIFLSYHHGGDAAARDRFERENGSVIRSSSIYPGEIIRKREVPRELRKRIVGCDFVVVMVGLETYARSWVDWEIHAALARDRGGTTKPVVGILLPEMATTGALLSSLLESPPPRMAVAELLRLSDELSGELVANTGATIPARLLDNLLTGYASLISWPASPTALLDALTSSIGRARSVNRRLLLTEDLPVPSHAL
jgi:hypothetical protein